MGVLLTDFPNKAWWFVTWCAMLCLCKNANDFCHDANACPAVREVPPHGYGMAAPWFVRFAIGEWLLAWVKGTRLRLGLSLLF